LAKIIVTANGKRIPIRLATDDETASNTSELEVTRSYNPPPGRWIAFRAVELLPYDSTINVTFERGVSSAEGPRTTEKPQSFSFKTFGALKFIGAFCAWDEKRTVCRPEEEFRLRFNNSLYPIALDESFIRVEPKIEKAKVFASGEYIYIQGQKKGDTTYKIFIDRKLKDVYGQTLGTDVAVTLKVGRADPTLYAQGGAMVVLDPFGNRSYSIYSTNVSTARVKLYAVEPKDWSAYQQYYRHLNYDDGQKAPMPGRLVSDKVVAIESKPDELVETRIDVSSALDGGFGNVVVQVEAVGTSTATVATRGRQLRVVSWLQSTEIGLDAFVDNLELVGFATELRTGKALSDVEMSIAPNDAIESKQAANTEPGARLGMGAGSGKRWTERRRHRVVRCRRIGK